MRIGQNDNLMAINIRQGSNQCIITEYIKWLEIKTMLSNISEHLRLNYILLTRHDIFSMTFVNFEITLK